MDKYDIWDKINELLDVAVSNLDKDDVDWLINELINDLEELSN